MYPNGFGFPKLSVCSIPQLGRVSQHAAPQRRSKTAGDRLALAGLLRGPPQDYSAILSHRSVMLAQTNFCSAAVLADRTYLLLVSVLVGVCGCACCPIDPDCSRSMSLACTVPSLLSTATRIVFNTMPKLYHFPSHVASAHWAECFPAGSALEGRRSCAECRLRGLLFSEIWISTRIIFSKNACCWE